MKGQFRLHSRYVKYVAAASLLSAGAMQMARAADDSEAVARAGWREIMAHNDAPDGCAHAAYPSIVWEKVECKVGHPLAHPVHVQVNGGGEITGNAHDYVAQAAGLITKTNGSFPTVTGVKSEKGVGVPAFGDSGILGKNEYTLQINTNYSGTTSVCAGHSGCTVWQQFIYASNYVNRSEGAVFMQYWLLDWGSSKCPTSFGSDGGGDCYRNSAYAAAPDMPITDLANLTISGSAVAGGRDTVTFGNGTDVYSASGNDSLLDISSVWHQSEFNIVGNGGGSRANFNTGSSVTIYLSLSDGSTAAPKCVVNEGSTGETNNLNLRPCTVAAGSSPAIKFTESN